MTRDHVRGNRRFPWRGRDDPKGEFASGFKARARIVQHNRDYFFDNPDEANGPRWRRTRPRRPEMRTQCDHDARRARGQQGTVLQGPPWLRLDERGSYYRPNRGRVVGVVRVARIGLSTRARNGPACGRQPEANLPALAPTRSQLASRGNRGPVLPPEPRSSCRGGAGRAARGPRRASRPPTRSQRISRPGPLPEQTRFGSRTSGMRQAALHKRAEGTRITARTEVASW
jgi:hypothetical protein